MSKKLIITEKPSVARDFARVLNVNGNKNGYIENQEYVISWCYGHLVQMVYPEDYDPSLKKWNLADLPFLPKEYKYGVIPQSKEQYNVVNSLLHRDDIDVVYWAGDSGKEGQTIEENIRNYGGVRAGMTELRVWIDSQTDDEIRRGINEAKPMSDYDLLGKSGIMRAIEDYSLGINFSRVLSVKYGKLINDAAATKSYTAIAIGRVMTCVLGMVVNREREIRNFTETPFYRISGNFSPANISAEWKAIESSKYFNSPLLYKENGFKKNEDAENLINELNDKKAVIKSLDKGVYKKRPPLLFNLAELQSECSKVFKINPNQTLQIVQELYERKLTTYPRTDARVLTTAIAKEISNNLYKLRGYGEFSSYVENILSNKLYKGLEKTAYTDDSKVTDHYAIIPTGYINGINNLSPIQKSVYDLIVRRFLSIFYPAAEYKTVKIQINVENEAFFASSKILVKPGYLEIAGIPKKSENEDLDDNEISNKKETLDYIEKLSAGEEISINTYNVKEGKTSPPKRYTSGNLILAMENAGNLIEDEELREQIKNTGIGTSATRGEILDKLIRIGYLNQNNKTQIITPEKLGEMIYEVVLLSFPSLLNPKMTASWEKGLEGIINGSVDVDDYRAKLEDFIRTETQKVIKEDLAHQIADNINQFTGKESKGLAARKKLGLVCPVCKGELITTPFGYGCNNYFDENIKCKFNVGQIANVDIVEEDFRELIENGRTKVIEGFVGKNKNKFKAALVLNKTEDGNVSINFDFTENTPDYLENVKCPACEGNMVITGFGYACENRLKNEPTCYFSIGKIAGKSLSQASVIELLTTGHTKTIRGFKSKNGKKFDACLVLTKNENDKTSIGFDFENVEAKVIKDVKCPICQGNIVKTSFGYGCANYDKQDDNSCRFMIGKIAGLSLNDSQVKDLLTNGITDNISGFKSKKGTKFEAKIALDYEENGKVKGCKFVFDDPKEEELTCTCPVCSGKIIKGHLGYRCINYSKSDEGCKFFVGKIAGVDIPKEQFIKLITENHTDKISGFTSKKGSTFDAALKLDENKKIVFDFEGQNN